MLNMVSGLTTEGIYRLCGQQSVVTRLLSSLVTGEILTCTPGDIMYTDDTGV